MATAGTTPQDTSLHRLLKRSSPLSGYGFSPEAFEKTLDYLEKECKILVVGAGGLGCELLKNLALSGFRCIHTVDMDEIDVSNLNRQFLFRPSDVGRPKAIVAAEFISKRIPNCRVTPHYCKIQDLDDDFYRQFKIVISGLDSIEARRWLNSKLVSLVAVDDDGDPNPDTIIPFIDGGSEGFKGQARVLLPRISACFECSLEAFPPQHNYPLCTLANTPRIPEHCIQWAALIRWDEARPFVDADGNAVPIDGDKADHLMWVFEQASQRAADFNIAGVTYKLTQGVVKRVIPAVASTNSIIAAACANEALKIATSCSDSLNNYMFYNGVTSVYTHTFEYERKPDCFVCASAVLHVANPALTLQEWFDELSAKHMLASPSVRGTRGLVYIQAPESLEKEYRHNLSRPLSALFTSGEEISLVVPSSNISISMTLVFEVLAA